MQGAKNFRRQQRLWALQPTRALSINILFGTSCVTNFIAHDEVKTLFRVDSSLFNLSPCFSH